jgi:hypothetical protein
LHRTVRSAAAEAHPEAYRDLKEPAGEVTIIVRVAEPAITEAPIMLVIGGRAGEPATPFSDP